MTTPKPVMRLAEKFDKMWSSSVHKEYWVKEIMSELGPLLNAADVMSDIIKAHGDKLVPSCDQRKQHTGFCYLQILHDYTTLRDS